MESLAFGTNFDNFRLVAAGVHLADNKLISDEAFALSGEQSETGKRMAYNQTWENITNTMNENFAAGANRLIFHGTSYDYSNAATGDSAIQANQWPGWHAFMNLVTETWNHRMPYWEDMDTIADYIARTEAVLQNGTPAMDVLVYSLTSYDHETRSRTGDNSSFTGMLDAGYSYDVVMTDGLSLAAQALADEPEMYKAVVVNDLKAATAQSMQELLTLAQGGMPIVFYKSVPVAASGKADTDAEIQALTDDIFASGNAQFAASQVGVVEALRSFGVEPYAQYEQAYLRSLCKKDGDGVTYYFFYNHNESPIAAEVYLQGTGTPFLLDAWSGEISPIAGYAAGEDGIVTTLRLDARDTAIIAVTPETAAFGNPVDNPIVSANAEAVVVDGAAKLRAEQSGTVTAEYDDGGTLEAEAVVPAPIDLDTCRLVINSWGPDETTESSIDTAITVLDIGQTALLPWNELAVSAGQLANAGVESMDFVSGTAQYTFQANLTAMDGAYLELEHGEDMVTEILVNGTSLGPINQAVDRFDLGSLLVQGENTIEIRLASTLINRVIAEHSRFSDFDHATYGITAAKIVPYALVG